MFLSDLLVLVLFFILLYKYLKSGKRFYKWFFNNSVHFIGVILILFYAFKRVDLTGLLSTKLF